MAWTCPFNTLVRGGYGWGVELTVVNLQMLMISSLKISPAWQASLVELLKYTRRWWW